MFRSETDFPIRLTLSMSSDILAELLFSYSGDGCRFLFENSLIEFPITWNAI